MLDWLSGDPGRSGADVSQIPDAPETPAPLFAYRALKGILFGSPDPNDDDEEDKENIAPAVNQATSKPSKQTSDKSLDRTGPPGKSPSSRLPSERARDTAPCSPSPRKGRLLSPTKSILRTPGIPTPRRQNVNVTFKDIRPSVSPAIYTARPAAIFEAPPVNQSLCDARKKSASASLTITRDVPVVVTASLPPPAKTINKQVAAAYDTREVDTYLKSTEREMKKLVRYSQKMKEYARLSQQESASLREENEMLKRELQSLRKTKGSGVLEVVGLPDAEGLNMTQQGPVGKRKEEDPAKSELTADAAGRSERTEFARRPIVRAQLPPDRLAAAKERLRVKSEARRRALSFAIA